MVKDFDVTTPDCRTLRARETGDPNGFPVFVHHGTPMAGTFFDDWIADANERGIRLISHDRPGYGGSDRAEGRKVADVAADVVAIADHLRIDRFATWGISGGGPHALACAALLPERLSAAASLAGVGPYDAPGLDFLAGMGEDNVTEFSTATGNHSELRTLLEKWRSEVLAAEPQEIFASLQSLLSEIDKVALSGPMAEFFHDNDQIALKDGVDGWFDDDLAFVKPWGFELSSIKVPVLLWQGRQDLMVPFSHGEWLAGRIPGVEARLSDDEGHITLAINGVGQTHEWLLAHSS